MLAIQIHGLISNIRDTQITCIAQEICILMNPLKLLQLTMKETGEEDCRRVTTGAQVKFNLVGAVLQDNVSILQIFHIVRVLQMNTNITAVLHMFKKVVHRAKFRI